MSSYILCTELVPYCSTPVHMQPKNVFLLCNVVDERDNLVLQPVPRMRTRLDAVLLEAFAAILEVAAKEEVARK